jgi:hypothetical protein
LGFFFTAVLAFSMPNVAVLENYFAQEKYQEMRQLLPSVLPGAADDPSVIFFRGFLHANPDSAVRYYQQVATIFPKSKYADYALFRLGQYFYFSGDYRKARNNFSSLVRGYPNSELRDDAQYLYCQCILAQGKADSAKLFLKAFVQNINRSPYVDNAIMDLESLGGLPAEKPAEPEQNRLAIGYAIQVASYKDFDEAKNALYKLAKVFAHVEVGESKLGNTTYYHVLIGSFDSVEKAQKYAELYIEPHLSEYKIVKHSL